ncbi:dethiobiotin synthase [Sporanaerobium hydrogeniformans]|uniref:Dethiobiotin synthase n=1 Tax=Sporanaerobium hydrogeniformans TaxID=3072179 RepID=A0AC61D713_9FIRM|nr:dethiobiotin synthase [Sporanaerobium hydrogeniformans]PHV69329.1 dethiobiotin synthase [Sporanaerobium hydrogeniformans]
MSKGLFIIGTGTDVGKTFVTALIIKKLKEAGFHAGYYKAALSGAEETTEGLIPGDAAYVKKIAKLSSPLESMVSYSYKTPVSPHLAAQLEGKPIQFEKVLADYQKACETYDFLTVEGSGGIVCPIRYDQVQQILLEDLIQAFNLPTLLVAHAGLGTLNATTLTVEYLKNRHIPIQGILLNYYMGSRMEEDNLKMLPQLTGIPVVGTLAPDANELAIDLPTLQNLYI